MLRTQDSREPERGFLTFHRNKRKEANRHMGDDIEELLKKFTKLELEKQSLRQQTAAVTEQQREVERAIRNKTTGDGRPHTKTKTRGVDPTDFVPTDRNGIPLSIGQRVECLTWGKFCESRGVITKVNTTRVTINLNNKGGSTTRDFNNIAVLQDNGVEQPNKNVAYGGKSFGKPNTGY